MPVLKILFAFFVCGTVGTGVAFVEAKAKDTGTRIYAWLVAATLLISLGAVL